MSGATQDELKWAYFITNEELLKRAREHGSKSTANLEMIRDQIFLHLEECTVPTTRPELLKSLERRVEKYLRPNNKYISLTEIARRFDSVKPNYVIQSWLRGRNTIEFLGEWERQNNSKFDETAFAQLKVYCKSANLSKTDFYGIFFYPEKMFTLFLVKVKKSQFLPTYIYEGVFKKLIIQRSGRGIMVKDSKTQIPVNADGNLSTDDGFITDESIVELYFARNESAIQETEKKYGQFLFRIANNILHDRLDSEECRNDTYLGIWNAIPPSRPEVFPAFISKIIRNIARDKYMMRKRQKRVPSEMMVAMDDLEGILKDGSTPDAELQAEELGKLINGFIGGLSDQQQYIFIGRFYIGDKLEVISEKLNMNVSKVYREIAKIKQDLKIHLERNGVYV